jgi:hypothetical protein
MSIVFIEQQIVSAVRRFLTGRVNELLGDMELQIPKIFELNYPALLRCIAVI